ncbi:MAG: hypothetical protein SFT94_11605 [Pseudanabaenaceae cyanobacterium bins.68]|nr:hypothetical protein [Pseudanabaenaceae cyanobacterium bins.68]
MTDHLGALVSLTLLAALSLPEYLIGSWAETPEPSNQQIIQEMITPMPSPGIPPAPYLVSQGRALTAAQNLYTAVNQILSTEDQKLTYEQINQGFNAYNQLITLLGLTNPAQIDNFPRLKTIGLALDSLQRRVKAPKTK